MNPPVDAAHLVMYVVVGFVVAALGTPVGVSGAFLLVPYQVSVLGLTTVSVSSTGLVFNVISAPAGVVRYWRDRAINWRLARLVLTGSIPAICAGAWLRVHLAADPRSFKILAGVVLLLLAARIGFGHVRRISELDGSGEMTANEALDAVFPQLKIIFVRRRDKVPQAVSLWKAIQTQQWRTDSEASDGPNGAAGTRPEITYDFQAIKYLLDELHRWDARWEDWFHATGREPIRIFYEEFTTTRAATIGRVLDALGIDPPVPEGQGPMQRQADDLSRDWVARFRSDADTHVRV